MNAARDGRKTNLKPEDRIREDVARNLVRLFSLEGKTALVTGAASGIGKRIGIALCSAGASVYFGDLDTEIIESAVDEAKSVGAGDANALLLDVTEPVSVERAFRKIKESENKMDLLVCSAGTSGSKWIEEMTLELWNRVLEVNLTGTFLCCKEAVKYMISQRWGRIINIASMAATCVPRPEYFKGGYNYSASKAGVRILTKRLAVELASYNITANSISPGWIETPLTAQAIEDKNVYEQMLDSIPLHRIGSAEDLDGLIIYLCSESSAYLTGQDILIDGGYSVW
jgi:NAD(P)-dependent dehydrogenase (short-subunit alcohol dehydrogenase family)